jgi:16S rRNA (uracil1498-N3)-methyltransferase
MRRILVKKVALGRIELAEAEAHHLRDVLRLKAGAEIEAFDEAGSVGQGRIVASESAGVWVEIDKVGQTEKATGRLTIAAAVPKGGRADWMIEKLSELGVNVFVPLQTRRSVVSPKGSSKNDRWHRLATESARQSGRAGVMQIEDMIGFDEMIQGTRAAGAEMWHLSPAEDSVPILEMVSNLPEELVVLVGPEGGWSPEELQEFRTQSVKAVRLTGTILRVETAAVTAAALIECIFAQKPRLH